MCVLFSDFFFFFFFLLLSLLLLSLFTLGSGKEKGAAQREGDTDY